MPKSKSDKKQRDVFELEDVMPKQTIDQELQNFMDERRMPGLERAIGQIDRVIEALENKIADWQYRKDVIKKEMEERMKFNEEGE